MEIIRTDLKENDFTMDLYYSLFEDEDRLPLREAAGKDLEFEHYAIYNDINGAGDEVELLVIQERGGTAYVTNSVPFITSFSRIMDMGERTGNTIRNVRIEERVGKNKRKFLHAKFIR